MSTASPIESDAFVLDRLGKVCSSVSSEQGQQVQFSIITFGYFHTLKAFLSSTPLQQR